MLSFFKSTILVLFLAIGLSAPAQASPAQEEKVEFCKTVAKNYQSGVDARKLGMSQDDLEARIMMFVMNLINTGMPEPLIHMLVNPILDGYFGRGSAEAHFQGCMSQEFI